MCHTQMFLGYGLDQFEGVMNSLKTDILSRE